MCGFGVTDRPGLRSSNQRCQRRGPDATSVTLYQGIEFLHNLLHITGTRTEQPFAKNGVVTVFNGEIYNYRDLGDYKTDGACIIDCYLTHGQDYARHLDGEFAIVIVDFTKNLLILSTDTFATKPLWYDVRPNGFCVGSYLSQLIGNKFTRGQKMLANRTLVFDLGTREKLHEIENWQFDIRQHKNTYDDWIQAFERSIQKRTKNTRASMFVGMSSGYDSGAIACELHRQNINFKAYSIDNNENDTVLSERLSVLRNTERFAMTTQEFDRWYTELLNNCEDFAYDDGVLDYDIKRDQASMGLAAICSRARKEGRKIYFSGQGADEIISDYGFQGRKIFKHSRFGGMFPDDLQGFWPWHSFWDGTQIQYLNKEEYVAGHFGIETRYPFLDRDLVQEFLWLTADLKNRHYKSALHAYLESRAWPFMPGEKLGFHVSDRKLKKKK
jgi:asparagine synthetase B (glutamine-hydrolysing)